MKLKVATTTMRDLSYDDEIDRQIDAEATFYLENAMEGRNFSARAHDRILIVDITLADLAGAISIRATNVLWAIQYRPLDWKYLSKASVLSATTQFTKIQNASEYPKPEAFQPSPPEGLAINRCARNIPN